MSKALDKILLDIEDRMLWMPEEAPRTFAEEVAIEYAEKVAVAFAEWKENKVGYSAGIPRQYAIRDLDSKLIYFNTFYDLYQYWIEKIYKK